MRELTEREMDQVNGGFLFQALGSCIAGAVSQNRGVLGGIMGCAGATASGLTFTLAAMSGPIGGAVMFMAGVGLSYATYRGISSF